MTIGFGMIYKDFLNIIFFECYSFSLGKALTILLVAKLIVMTRRKILNGCFEL